MWNWALNWINLKYICIWISCFAGDSLIWLVCVKSNCGRLGFHWPSLVNIQSFNNRSLSGRQTKTSLLCLVCSSEIQHSFRSENEIKLHWFNCPLSKWVLGNHHCVKYFWTKTTIIIYSLLRISVELLDTHNTREASFFWLDHSHWPQNDNLYQLWSIQK